MHFAFTKSRFSWLFSLRNLTILTACFTASTLIAEEKPIETITADGSRHIIIKRPEQKEAEEQFITAKGVLKTKIIRHLNDAGNFIQSDYYNEFGRLYAYELPEFSKEGPAKSIKWMDKNKALIYTVYLFPNFKIIAPDGESLTQEQVDAINAKLRSE